MSSLLLFLRVVPFHIYGQFQRRITAPLKRGDITGLQRLHKVTSQRMVRRTKDMLNLPSRHDILVEVELSSEERSMYEMARNMSDALINESLSQGSNSTNFNILQSLIRQRQICCHGLDLFPAVIRAVFVRSSRVEAAMKNINNKQEFLVFCEVCSIEIKLSEEASTLSDCMHIICNKCVRVQSETFDVCCPLCSEEGLSPNKRGQPSQSLQEWTRDLQYQGPSSKVSCLLENLYSIRKQRDGNGKPAKSVVFSSWTRFLHLTGLALASAGIDFVTYDGTLSRIEKQRVLTNFRTSPGLTVLLILIGSGGVGYVHTRGEQVVCYY